MRTETKIAAAIVIGLCMLLGLFVWLDSAYASPKVKDPQAQCRTSEGNGYSNRDVAQAIRCAERKWSVAGGFHKALAVAKCESGLNEHNEYAGHVGVYQHVRSYWPARFRAHRVRGWHMHPSPFNARSNVVVSIRMVHSGGWGPWSCA